MWIIKNKEFYNNNYQEYVIITYNIMRVMPVFRFQIEVEIFGFKVQQNVYMYQCFNRGGERELEKDASCWFFIGGERELEKNVSCRFFHGGES